MVTVDSWSTSYQKTRKISVKLFVKTTKKRHVVKFLLKITLISED